MVISIFCLNLIFGAYDEEEERISANLGNVNSVCRINFVDFYSSTTSELRKNKFGLEEQDVEDIFEEAGLGGYISELKNKCETEPDPDKIKTSLEEIKKAANLGSLPSIKFLGLLDPIPPFLELEKDYLDAQEAIIFNLESNHLSEAFRSIADCQFNTDNTQKLLTFLIKVYGMRLGVDISFYKSRAEELEDCISKYLINEDSLNLTRIGLILAGGSLGVSLYACITDSCKSQGGTAGIVITGVCAAGGKLVETVYKTITTKRKKALEERAKFPRTAKILGAYFALSFLDEKVVLENNYYSYVKHFFRNSSKDFLGKKLIKDARKNKQSDQTIEAFILSDPETTEATDTSEQQDVYPTSHELEGETDND